MMEKGLITIAIGKKFVRQAKHLALSCILRSPQTLRGVITDDSGFLRDYYDLILPYNPAFGDPFNTKLRLPLYSPFEKTLYLDADSLVYAGLDYYFDLLKDQTLLYQGELLTGGIWYMDIAEVIKKEQVPALPRFNSGMLLFNRGEKTAALFDTAFGLLDRAADYGIGYFRGQMLPDEPFLSIAFARHGIAPVEDYGRFSYTLIRASRINLHITKGIAWFYKDGRMQHPRVVHFCSRLGGLYYRREKCRLLFYLNSPLSILISSVLTLVRGWFKTSIGKRKKTP